MHKWSLYLIALLILAAAAFGCSPQGRTVAPGTASVSATAAPASATPTETTLDLSPIFPQSFGVEDLRQRGYHVRETTETAKLTAKDMIAKASKARFSPDATNMAVTVTKARVTGIELDDRLVWIVTVTPVMSYGHGPPGGSRPRVGVSRNIYDANTGEFLQGAVGNPGRIRK